jgi:hypothetical protein
MDFWTPSHRKDKKGLYYLTKYYFLLFKTAGCVSGCRIVENALLVGTVERVARIDRRTQLPLGWNAILRERSISNLVIWNYGIQFNFLNIKP